MRIAIGIFLILASFFSFGQRNYLYGIVQDSTSSEPMIGVNISNLSAGLITSTNDVGNFKIPVQSGDSITISYVGYRSITYIKYATPSSDTVKFRLVPHTTLLREVEVNIFPEYWRFKQQVIDHQEVDSSLVIFGLDNIPLDAYPLQANEAKVKPDNYHAPGFKVGFNLDGMTKKGKEKKKLQKILAAQEMERKAYRKFSRDWISQETNLTGDELTNFIVYCNFTSKYLVEASLFEIRNRMMALLEDFKSGKSKKRDKSNNPGA